MFAHKHLLSIDDLSPEDIMTVLKQARTFEEINERPIKKVPALRGKTVCNLFLEPSTRTRGSFELAEKRVACDSLNAGGSTSSTVKGESLVDTVRTLDSMKVDMFIVRHKCAGAPYIVSQNTSEAVIDAGVIEDVDIALGLHIRPVQDIAYGEMSPAVRHASSTFVNVVINGLSSHGARPHLGVNAFDAAAVAINAITAIKINPIIPWSCKVTGIKGGGVAPNIIPDKVEMIVDARAQTNEAMTELLENLRRAVTNAAAALGATAEVTTPGGVIPAAEYAAELTAEVAECIVEVVGEEKLAKELVNPGGEDFHYFVNKYPHIKAAYFGVGAAEAPGLHHQDMQLNKEALPSGTAVLVKMVERKLG